MFSLPIGFFLTLLVVALSVNPKEWVLYLNMHAVIIVVGGTIAVFIFSNPTKVIRSMLRSFRDMAQKDLTFKELKPDFEDLIRSRSLSRNSRNPLVNYAVSLWESGISGDMFIALIAQKRSELEHETMDAVQALRNLSKYPPALGMTGTVIGLVSLFSQLSAESRAGIGPALGLAMTATFFGLIVANALVTPLGDRLHVHYITRKRLYQQVYQALILINRGETIDLIMGAESPYANAA